MRETDARARRKERRKDLPRKKVEAGIIERKYVEVRGRCSKRGRQSRRGRVG